MNPPEPTVDVKSLQRCPKCGAWCWRVKDGYAGWQQTCFKCGYVHRDPPAAPTKPEFPLNRVIKEGHEVGPAKEKG
jgi:hypothetical protein